MHDGHIIIGNWKMNLDAFASRALADELRKKLAGIRLAPNLEVVVCPSYDALASVGEALSGSALQLGAQDVFWQEKGAYTGEISASMLAALGVRLVIVGHSERRTHLHETDELVNMKVKAALSQGMTPVLCVGETYDERRIGHTELILMRQVVEGLKGITLGPDNKLVIAYEPVWVIGTGQAIDPAQAERAIQVIRQSLIDLYPPATIATQIRVIYGGSVDPGNIANYTTIPGIRGVLVGAASIHAENFIKLLASFT
ncbi:MAG: triose-phosphate isomerase [Candidatus Komeilibacteria bacterium]|nr:triose-phosphate isomerase [Candidatus Komeilibacteria bacterium]